MNAPRESKTTIGSRELHPDTLMLNYGYDPFLSEGAVKPPVFLTSTFVFPTAEEGRDFFDYVAGRKGAGWSIRASITPTARSSKTGWRFTKVPRRAWYFLQGWRRSPPPCWPSSSRAR